jgi:hypothetical protein
MNRSRHVIVRYTNIPPAPPVLVFAQVRQDPPPAPIHVYVQGGQPDRAVEQPLIDDLLLDDEAASAQEAKR